MKIVLTLLTLVALQVNADPTIVASSASTSSYKTYDNKTILDTNYGEDITLFCTSSAENLTIANQNEELQADRYNSTTIQAVIKTPDVGEHVYHCTDSVGQKQSLIVTVYPAVSVISPKVRQTTYLYKTLYFVPQGESYDVFCSANNNESLSLTIYSNDFEELETKVDNATVYATVVNDIEGKSYICRKNEIHKFFDIIVDKIPEAQDFQCVLYLFHKLECTWKSSSAKNTFKLFSKEKLLCTDMSGGDTGSCERAWNRELYDAYSFSPIKEHLPLRLEVCNEIYCNNQTFSIKMSSIIKVDPVYNLQVEYTKVKTTVEWRHKNFLCYRQCDFKVEYRIGMHWRSVDVSHLESYEGTGSVWYTLQLPVPCPDTRYEVRVYVKPLSAKEERFWSQPVSVEYVTPPRAYIDRNRNHDDACAEFRRQEPKPASGEILKEARELMREINFNQKRKLTEMKALLDII